MKRSIRRKKVLPVIFAIMLILAVSSTASAISWTDTNNKDAWIDNSGTFPPSNGWFKLILPDWYDASKVTLFKISMHGYGDNSASNIDVWLSRSDSRNTSNSIKIDAFNAPLTVPFDKTWNIPFGSVDFTYFSGLPHYFYIGYGCHFTHDWSKVEITQRSVPEPTTMLLLGLGLIGLAGVRRKIK
jgi:hypothetical protein